MRYIEEAFSKMCRKIVIDLIIMMRAMIKQNSKKTSINSNKPLMILGPSAVGKNTLINKLKTKFPKVIYKLPSYTTRPKRNGEIDGVDYSFITKEEFLKLKNEGKLIGVHAYNNNYYALNKNKLKEALGDKTKLIILNYKIEMANIIKDELDCNYIAIYPPCEAALKERLIKKKTKAEEIEKKMEEAIKEIKLINEANYINYRLVNNEEEKAYNKLEKHLKEIYPQLI